MQPLPGQRLPALGGGPPPKYHASPCAAPSRVLRLPVCCAFPCAAPPSVLPGRARCPASASTLLLIDLCEVLLRAFPDRVFAAIAADEDVAVLHGHLDRRSHRPERFS